MEVRIKTHEEFKIDRVTIEIRGERDEIESAVDQVADLRGQLERATQRALNLDAALSVAQAGNDKLARDLETVVESRDEAFAESRQMDNTVVQKDIKIAELERQLESALSRIETLEKSRNEERLWVDWYLDWGHATEAKLADSTAKLGEIQAIIYQNPISLALDGEEDPADYSDYFAAAIKDIRRIIDQEPSTIE